MPGTRLRRPSQTFRCGPPGAHGRRGGPLTHTAYLSEWGRMDGRPPTQSPATHARGEQVLTEFRKSPNVVPICQYILAQSSSPAVLVHVALALRDGVIREWSLRSTADLVRIRDDAISYCLDRADRYGALARPPRGPAPRADHLEKARLRPRCLLQATEQRARPAAGAGRHHHQGRLAGGQRTPLWQPGRGPDAAVRQHAGRRQGTGMASSRRWPGPFVTGSALDAPWSWRG